MSPGFWLDLLSLLRRCLHIHHHATRSPLDMLSLQDDINRQNAAYCSGLLVEASPQHAAPHMPQLLAALHNMFRAEEAAGAQDNAVGAVGRIMTALPQALPLQQVLPVLLGALPLKVCVLRLLAAVTVIGMCLSCTGISHVAAVACCGSGGFKGRVGWCCRTTCQRRPLLCGRCASCCWGTSCRKYSSLCRRLCR